MQRRTRVRGGIKKLLTDPINALRAERLLRSGPIEPGSIREAIVAVYWIDKQQAEAYKTMALALSPQKDRFDEVHKLLGTYLEKHLHGFGKTPKSTIESMQQSLQDWVSRGRISIPGSAIFTGNLGTSRAVQKFAGLRRRGRGDG